MAMQRLDISISDTKMQTFETDSARNLPAGAASAFGGELIDEEASRLVGQLAFVWQMNMKSELGSTDLRSGIPGDGHGSM